MHTCAHTGGVEHTPPTAHEAPLLALAIALHLTNAALLVLQLLRFSDGRILLLLQDLLLLLVHFSRVKLASHERLDCCLWCHKKNKQVKKKTLGASPTRPLGSICLGNPTHHGVCKRRPVAHADGGADGGNWCGSERLPEAVAQAREGLTDFVDAGAELLKLFILGVAPAHVRHGDLHLLAHSRPLLQHAEPSFSRTRLVGWNCFFKKKSFFATIYLFYPTTQIIFILSPFEWVAKIS